MTTLANFKLKTWNTAMLFGIVALLITFPTILRLHTSLFGYATDGPYYLWLTWWRRYSLGHGLDYNFQPMMQAPFGAQQVTPGFSGLMIPMTLLSIVVGEVAAYNLMIILAYALSGWLASLVVQRLVQNQVLAIIGSLLFMLSPYAMANTLHHVDLAQQWVIPLFALALMNMRVQQSIISALLLGGAFALANYINPYYGYHVVIMALTYGIVESIYIASRSGWQAIFVPRRLLLYTIAIVSGIVIFAPELISIARATYGSRDPLHPFNQLAQPNEWFFYGSSRPWDFFVPSINHPVLGGFARQVFGLIGSIQRLDFRLPFFQGQGIDVDNRWFWASHPSAQETMYLGFANLAAASYGIFRWRSRSLSLPREPLAQGERSLWLAYFLTLAVIAILFTLPPYLPVGAMLRPIWAPLHNIAIPMPSLFTMNYLAPLRGVIRIMPVVVLCLTVWAATGLEALLDNSKLTMRWAIVTGFVLIAGFEYLRLPTVTLFSAPDYTHWLAAQPDDTLVIMYPFQSGQAIFQYVHEKALVNTISRPGTPPDTLVLTEQTSIGLLRNGVPARLAALGADYVIVNSEVDASQIDGLRQIQVENGARIYQITAQPDALAVLYTPTGDPWKSDAEWSWRSGSKTLYVWNTYAYPVSVTLNLNSDDESVSTVRVKRVLTMLEADVILYGIRKANPLLGTQYPDEPLEFDGSNGVVGPIKLEVGETILTLRWAGSTQPNITDINIVVNTP